MDFSFKNCWDCPVPLWTLLVQFALLFLSGAVGAWMWRTCRRGVRELGAMIATFTLLWAAEITLVVPRWGILRDDVPFNVFANHVTYLIFAGLDLALATVIFITWRRASRHGVPT